ncbi:hypothetical protein Sjap_010696 [Stephania japonica]|uniref:USP domain-containing protein n=1 Tax=Stephania japonica TaxID=461633 RepID=A0AAP0P4T6_9MAGN
MHVSGIPVDLYPLLQFVFTAIVIALGLLHLVKTTASKYFVVDASFDEGGEGVAAAAVEGRGKEREREQMIGASLGRSGDVCAVCPNFGLKQCSGCKTVRYWSIDTVLPVEVRNFGCIDSISITCQSEHWKAEHKLKCKDFALNSRKNLVSCVSRTTLPQIKKVLFPYEEFVKLFNWETPGYPPCGLLNCGNSCFANVVLQCLSCTRPLVAYMFEKDHLRDCRRNDWCFLCELQVHVQRARQSLQPLSPINILSRLPNIGGNLGYGKQEDAHEFMRFAIDTMQSVCLDEFGGEKSLHPTSQVTTLIHYIFGGQLQSQIHASLHVFLHLGCCYTSFYVDMINIPLGIGGGGVIAAEVPGGEKEVGFLYAMDIPMGQNAARQGSIVIDLNIRCCVTCTECNKISHRYENMMDLTVEIQGDAASLEDCLDQFTAQECLDGDNMYKCDGCNDYVKARKRLTIHQAPNVLTVALKRFQSGRFGKLNKRVTFPETLKLGPYMSKPGDGTDLYQLYGVVVHIDMLNASFFGHYICYIKDFGGNWYMIDDNKVSTVDLEEVLSQGAYMLLYSRTSVRPSHTKPTETFKEDKQLMELIKEDLPCVSTNAPQVNGISSEETLASGLTLSTEESSSEIEDLMDIDEDTPLRVKPLSITEYQDVDLGNPQSISLCAEDLDVSSVHHTNSTESVPIAHIVQRDMSNSCSLGEASSSTQVHYIESGASGNSFYAHSSFEAGAMAGGNLSKENVCTVENGIYGMIGKPSSDGSALGLRTAHEAQFASYQSPQNFRLEQVGTAESVEESPAVQNREFKSLKVHASCSHGNLKPVFGKGFLNKPTGCKSLNASEEAQIEPHEASQSCKVANNCHGSVRFGSPHQGTGDNHGGIDLDYRGESSFRDTQLNNFIDTGDSGFDNLPAEVATPVERACKVVYSSSFLSQSSSVEINCSKHEELSEVVKNENGFASHDIRTPICMSSQNGSSSHDMGTLASVPLASSSAPDESNLLCLPHLANNRLTNSESSEENSCSSLSFEFQDKQTRLAYQNGNGSYTEICEDGPVQRVNNYNEGMEYNILDPDVMVLDHNGSSMNHFMEDRHENFKYDNWMPNGVLSETVKEHINSNGDAASITDDSKSFVMLVP